MSAPVVFGTRPLPPPRERRRSRLTLWACVLAAVVLVVLVDRVGADEPDRLTNQAPDAGLLNTQGPSSIERFQPSSRGADAVERWRPLVSRYEWDADTALAIVRCESRGQPGAVNPSSGATGLMQLMPELWQRLANALHGAWASLRDPGVNVRTAYELYVLFDGWSPWWSSRGCWGAGW